MGYDGAANHVYQSQSGNGTFTSIFTATSSYSTSSVAWGDWNNDGKPDLAVGNENQADLVYANQSSSSQDRFVWVWQSTETGNTTDLAWGDVDNDGDLDLAVSSQSSSSSGVYKNNYITAGETPLPHNPAYINIHRPTTKDAYFFSSAAITNTSLVTLAFNSYDPEADEVTVTSSSYEYLSYDANSLGTWQTVTSGTTSYTGATSAAGQANTIVWDTDGNTLISDDVRLRITLIHKNKVGPVQRATTRAVSPPFRVLPLTCEWPDGVTISTPTTTPDVGSEVSFTGGLAQGTGHFTFTWDFGNSVITTGQTTSYSYTSSGLYTVTLTVLGEPCPTIREAATTQVITVGTSTTSTTSISYTYLPIVNSDGSSTIIADQDQSIDPTVPIPGQVTGLSGRSRGGSTTLQWAHNPATDGVLGYNIYRSSRSGAEPFQIITTVEANTTSYVDPVACGQMYYIKAFNAGGESLPSTASYFSRPCR